MQPLPHPPHRHIGIFNFKWNIIWFNSLQRYLQKFWSEEMVKNSAAISLFQSEYLKNQHLCETWKKNRSKISNFTAVLKYWEFSSRMRKHTTPIQMVQATSDAITFCEKEKRKEIHSERTFLFLWKYIFLKYFKNITKEIFRENAGEIKIRITHQKLFHPIFRVSCTLKKRGV